MGTFNRMEEGACLGCADRKFSQSGFADFSLYQMEWGKSWPGISRAQRGPCRNYLKNKLCGIRICWKTWKIMSYQKGLPKRTVSIAVKGNGIAMMRAHQNQSREIWLEDFLLLTLWNSYVVSIFCYLTGNGTASQTGRYVLCPCHFSAIHFCGA